jgi:LacI family transcriptional regulator
MNRKSKPVAAVESGPPLRSNHPKYRAVYEALLRSIRRGEFPPGSKLPTETQLVEQFHVSRITVIRALRDLQAAGLVRRRRGSGSFIEGPRPSNLTAMGLIMPVLEPGSIFATVHQVLSREAQKQGWQIAFQEISDQEPPKPAADTLEDLFSRGIRGIFYLPLPVRAGWAEVNEAIARQCAGRKIPLVLLDRDIHHLHDRSGFDVIGSDNELGGFLAARHLLERGCRRIVFFSDSREHPTAEARLEGVRSAVALSAPASLEIASGDGDDQELIASILRNSKPDGIACVNDLSAAKVLRSLMKAGIKVPQQIKLTGFDDTSTAALLAVPLTTVRQSPEAMAIQAMNVMRQRLERPDLPAITLAIACAVVKRESTAVNDPSSLGR